MTKNFVSWNRMYLANYFFFDNLVHGNWTTLQQILTAAEFATTTTYQQVALPENLRHLCLAPNAATSVGIFTARMLCLPPHRADPNPIRTELPRSDATRTCAQEVSCEPLKAEGKKWNQNSFATNAARSRRSGSLRLRSRRSVSGSVSWASSHTRSALVSVRFVTLHSSQRIRFEVWNQSLPTCCVICILST